jgi:hypothetical protein
MKWYVDQEITDIVNQYLKSPKTRETISRWRSQTRCPKLHEIREIEDALKLPFDVLLRDADFQRIKNRLEEQIKNMKKLIHEEIERDEIKNDGKK